MESARRRRPYACAWCGRSIVDSETGRRRKYCKQACRQRAYEQRSQVSGTSVPADAVILSTAEAEQLVDRLFELRCAAEDVATAVAEKASHDELTGLCRRLLEQAADADRLR
ncbi:hypothetical protein [Williamsia phyllosphaerae]|uniref:Recombinase zinc beta ribbon domain-containing protein n=1 Tax=Williamsia phyllosphaerae TaxID=885042 RepID=A0ABQ1V7M2_9NOCA|nr:hypothetical protein [Williamsia phyllosphaerae]GGF42737.1 hypothetical protein GCM10007298_43040 [Williamsia phyllosphaerae]